MKRKLFIIIAFTSLTLLCWSCKKEDETDVKISAVFQVNAFPQKDSALTSPTLIPYVTFNYKIDHIYYDAKSKKHFVVMIDNFSFVTQDDEVVVFNRKYSSEKDTLYAIPYNDLIPNQTYKLKVNYRFFVCDKNGENRRTYTFKGEPQIFEFVSLFTVSEYPFFDVGFKITSYPLSGVALSYLKHPYLTFNMNIGELYQIPGVDRKFKICIDSAGVYSLNNIVVQSTCTYSILKDTLRLFPNQALTTNSGYKTKIKYHVEIKDKNSDSFMVLKKGGLPFIGNFESVFNTGMAATIDISNIDYAYPSPYQYHFLRYESTRGVLKLKNSSSLKALRNALERKGTQFVVRFSSLTGQKWDTDATYDSREMKFVFSIQGENFENQKIYKIEYVLLDDVNGSETIFLTYHFRTSMFDKFEQKLASINSVTYTRLTIGSNCYNGFVKTLLKHFNIQEGFDMAEGKAYNGLVRFDAYRDPASPWVYEMFKFYDLFEKSSLDKNFRPRTPVHIPPTNAIAFNSTYLVPSLSDAQINSGVALDAGKSFQRLEFNLVKYYTSDYCSIWNSVCALENPTQYDIQLRQIGYTGIYSSTKYKFYIYYYAGDSITYKGDWVILF